MRLRRRAKRTIDITPEAVISERTEKQEPEGFEEKEPSSERKQKQVKKSNPDEKKKGKNSKKSSCQKNEIKFIKQLEAPASLFRKIVQNPNFSSQMMVIIFSLLSDNVALTRPIENMTSAIDKVRNISDVLNTTMQSVKVAAEVPTQIRRLLK